MEILYTNKRTRRYAVPVADILGSNLANVASLIWHALKSMPYPSNEVNWAGE